MPSYFSDFEDAASYAFESLKHSGAMVDAGRWQGVPTEGKPDLQTKELLDLQFNVNLERASWHDPIRETYVETLAREIHPNLPWADEHFAERIGGLPLNPDPSYKNWPWWRGQEAAAMSAGYQTKFTHTYSERFWPKQAGRYTLDRGALRAAHGIRYPYGDYGDVLDLLAREPHTRQAYLPIFFPEDTGAVHGGRIPCSLGYHFLLRGNRLHCWYDIRSCDAVRHFRDDLYLAARLVDHTLTELVDRELHGDAEQLWVDVNPGILFFKCHSFHVHMGDYHLL